MNTEQLKTRAYLLTKVNDRYLIDVDGGQYTVSNPGIISRYSDGKIWPGEVSGSFREMVEPCKDARKCIEGEKGNETCKGSCQLSHMSDELFVNLLTYVNLSPIDLIDKL